MKLSRNAFHVPWRTLWQNPRVRRLMSVVVMLCTIAFLVILIVRGREELQQFTNWQDYLNACIVGFLLYPISLVIHAWVWSRMIARLGNSQSGWWDIEIYAYTHLMRRLPGAVWYLATRGLMYHDRGVKPSATLVASGLEWLWMLLAGIFVYAWFTLNGPWPWLFGLAVLGGVWIIGRQAPRLIRSLSHWQHAPASRQRWIERVSAVHPPKASDLPLWLAAYMLTYGIAGIIFFVLVRSVAPASSPTIQQAMRVWALTASVGTLVSGLVPAGLGIRELTITALLAPHVPAVAALLIAVLTRLIFLAGDLVWGGLMFSVARTVGGRRARKGRPEQPGEAAASLRRPPPNSYD